VVPTCTTDATPYLFASTRRAHAPRITAYRERLLFQSPYEDLVRDSLVQLCRNSVAHGVETPATRAAAGKAEAATLSIHALPSPAPGVVGLAIRDDGKGIDLDAVEARAKQAGLLPGDATPEPTEILNCLFESGFSTTETADAHSGRGVGLDIVKAKVVDEAGGCLEVHTEPGRFCEFRLYLPLCA